MILTLTVCKARLTEVECGNEGGEEEGIELIEN